MNDTKNNGDNHVLMTKRQASYLISCSLLCAFFIFGAGYFWGKKQTCEALSEDVRQEVIDQRIALDKEIAPSPDVPAQEPVTVASTQDQQAEQVSQEQWRAHLIGFGSHKNAAQYVERLKKRGIDTKLATRVSKPANPSRKNMITWYQVVTESYTDKHQLELMIEKIKQSETLHGVQIVKVDHDGDARKNT